MTDGDEPATSVHDRKQPPSTRAGPLSPSILVLAIIGLTLCRVLPTAMTFNDWGPPPHVLYSDRYKEPIHLLGRGPYDDLHRNFRTGGAWWAGVKKGWSETSVVLILHAVTGDSTLVGDHLSEHEWQESMWYRPELKYNPQMTDAQAEVNAQNLNDRIKGVLFQASHSSVYGLGATLGALCDPLFLLILLFLGFELFRDRRLPKPIKYWLSGIGVLAGTTLRIISAPIWFPIKVGKKQAPKDRSKDEPPSL